MSPEKHKRGSREHFSLKPRMEDLGKLVADIANLSYTIVCAIGRYCFKVYNSDLLKDHKANKHYFIHPNCPYCRYDEETHRQTASPDPWNE